MVGQALLGPPFMNIPAYSDAEYVFIIMTIDTHNCLNKHITNVCRGPNVICFREVLCTLNSIIETYKYIFEGMVMNRNVHLSVLDLE